MLKHALTFIQQEQKNMNEDLFVKLLDLRKYLDDQSDKFIAAGFDINSEFILKFFESMEGIEKHIEKIMNLTPFWNNYTTLSLAIEALDSNREFSWNIDDIEYLEDENEPNSLITLLEEELNYLEYVIGVQAIIINSNKQILISKRSSLKEKYPLKWECNGGALLSGEDAVDGLIREIYEELGITLEKTFATSNSLAYKLNFDLNTEVTGAVITIGDGNGYNDKINAYFICCMTVLELF